MAFLCSTSPNPPPRSSTSLLHPLHPPAPLVFGSPLCTVHFFPPTNQYAVLPPPLSTPNVTHIWPADKLWMGASHITSKMSIVFVNGWSILRLASSSKPPVPLLCFHFHPMSLLQFFVCLWLWLAGSDSGAGVSRVVTSRKSSNKNASLLLFHLASSPCHFHP